MPDTPAAPFAVLVVCTGNICRSALAERLLRARLDGALGRDSGLVTVSSAGVRAVVGAAMEPDAAAALRALGGDPDGFVARALTPGLVAEADLVLTMTRSHRASVVSAEPRAVRRTFTLVEMARLASADEVVATMAQGSGVVARLRLAVAEAAVTRGMLPPLAAGEDEIGDPMGATAEVHRRVAGQIADALAPLVGLVAGGATHLRAAPAR